MTTKGAKPFVLNMTSHVAHRRPTREQCNVDQAARVRYASLIPQSYRRCIHCFEPLPGREVSA